jgi:hypothetical protein
MQVTISRSVDGGATWTNAVLLQPPDEGSGFATGSCPVLHAQGRLPPVPIQGWRVRSVPPPRSETHPRLESAEPLPWSPPF